MDSGNPVGRPSGRHAGLKGDLDALEPWRPRGQANEFQKSGHKDDARAVNCHLKSLPGKRPTVLGLEKPVVGQVRSVENYPLLLSI
jgi:hypothetical protein